jgi:hypothetical protein
MATPTYDPKKAELYNKLRKSGISEDQAWTQAGITPAEEFNYVINDSPYNNDGSKNLNRGEMGAHIFGGGTKTFTPFTAAEKAESDAYNKSLESSNFEQVDYPVKASSQPSTKTPINYTTTSTEQVSGGGSTTIIAPQPLANDTSRAIQAQADVKSAELKQYLAENPRNGNYTPEQAAARREKIDSLVAERGKLASQAAAAETPQDPIVTTTPNTTTNTSTTNFSQSSNNSDVETIAGPDPALNQEPTLDNTQVQAARAQAAQDPYNDTAASQELVQNDAPAPVDTPLLTPSESIARAQVSAPESVDAATFNANTNAGVLGAIGVPESAPAPVNPATDPGVKGPFGGAAFTTAAAQNPEAAAAALQQEQANQAAAMGRKAREEAAVQEEFQSPANGDWRVRLRLAPGATYLYKDANVKTSILAPLAASNGVVFPYMPTIQTTYNANYESVELTHSNYRGQFYKSSYVGDVQITGTFTAQDTAEANYLLAVIHFFRSVTKMFYGAEDPLRGAPPPLVYLIGLGQYQFNNQPCVVKTFNYSMPNDCDYIRTKPNNYNTNLGGRSSKPQTSANPISSVVNRLQNALLPQGAVPNVPAQGLLEMQSVTNIADATYVPTKCEIQLTLMPIQTRSQQSQQFNMENFANGNLLKAGFW